MGESQHTKIKFDLSVITSKKDNGFGIEVSFPNIVSARVGSQQEFKNTTENRLSFEIFITSETKQETLNRRRESDIL